MSCYCSYYLCYRKDGIVHQLGPFDASGEWYPVLAKDQTFASDLYMDFRRLPEEEMDEKLREHFECCDIDRDGKLVLWHLPLDELPDGEISRTRYCLTETVMKALNEGMSLEVEESLECGSLTPAEYAVRAEAEIKHRHKSSGNRNQKEKHSCEEYTLFTWMPRNTPEFEANRIRTMARVYEFSDLLKDAEGVEVILTIR